MQDDTFQIIVSDRDFIDLNHLSLDSRSITQELQSIRTKYTQTVEKMNEITHRYEEKAFEVDFLQEYIGRPLGMGFDQGCDDFQDLSEEKNCSTFVEIEATKRLVSKDFLEMLKSKYQKKMQHMAEKVKEFFNKQFLAKKLQNEPNIQERQSETQIVNNKTIFWKEKCMKLFKQSFDLSKLVGKIQRDQQRQIMEIKIREEEQVRQLSSQLQKSQSNHKKTQQYLLQAEYENRLLKKQILNLKKLQQRFPDTEEPKRGMAWQTFDDKLRSQSSYPRPSTLKLQEMMNSFERTLTMYQEQANFLRNEYNSSDEDQTG